MSDFNGNGTAKAAGVVLPFVTIEADRLSPGVIEAEARHHADRCNNSDLRFTVRWDSFSWLVRYDVIDPIDEPEPEPPPQATPAAIPPDPATASEYEENALNALAPSRRGKGDDKIGTLRDRRIDRVRAREYQWFWPGRVAFGEPALYYGDCDQGKSLLSINLASTLTRGLPWPDAPGQALPSGCAAFLQDEDSVEETVRPRIDAAGGDPARIFSLDCVEYEGGRYELLSLVRHMREIDHWLKAHPQVRLLVIDPLSAYMHGCDPFDEVSVRGLVMRPLAAMSRRWRVAVAMFGHVTKSSGTKAIYRSMNSGAIVAATRSAYLVATDADNRDRRLVASSKFNLGLRPSGLAYRFDGPKIVWEPETIPGLTADGVLEREHLARLKAERGRKPSETQQAVRDWLSDELTPGPVPIAELLTKARELGFSRNHINRAIKKLDAESFERDGGRFYRLPDGLLDLNGNGHDD